MTQLQDLQGRTPQPCEDADCTDLVCPCCYQALHVTTTAYGARASCTCPDIRWTAIRPADDNVMPQWVAEKR